MEILEAIESLKNNNELCLDNCEGECGSYKDGKCYCADALVVSALEEYIAIGTVEEVKRMQRYSALAKKHSTIGQVIDSCAEYEAIGTVEECREARERQIPKKLIHGGLYACPNCHTIMLQGAFEAKGKCCKECGQVLDWSETV